MNHCWFFLDLVIVRVLYLDDRWQTTELAFASIPVMRLLRKGQPLHFLKRLIECHGWQISVHTSLPPRSISG